MSGVLASIKIDSKLVFKHHTMFVCGFKMCFEYISSHPPGRTAGSLIDTCIIKKVRTEYIFLVQL